MSSLPMPFLKAFPKLNIDESLMDLMRFVTVERVIFNQSRSRLRIYILSENWLKRKNVELLESKIAALFPERKTEVRIVERYHLSASYTPVSFYKAYKSSMLFELKKADPLIRQVFLSAEIEFKDGELICRIPESIISKRLEPRLIEYLEKVFAERAGFSNLQIRGEFVAPAKNELETSEEEKILARVRAISQKEAPKEVEEAPKKLPVKEEKHYRKKAELNKDKTLIYGRGFDSEAEDMALLGDDPRTVTVWGEIFSTEIRETKSGRRIMTVALTDYTDSVRMKLWFDEEEEEEYTSVFRKGECFLVNGLLDFDPFDREMMLKSVYGIKKAAKQRNERIDTAEVKRVELHCHTQMSDMDAVSSATALIKRAHGFGMKALAITDHGVVQAFPEANKALGGKGGIPKDADFKVLYGCEAYLVDDMKEAVKGRTDRSIEDPYLILTLVTTGQSPLKHDILEIAALKYEGGQITGRFEKLINPGRPIPFAIQSVCGITDEMVLEKGEAREDVLRDFFEFAGNAVPVLYEAESELNFLMDAAGKCGLKVPWTSSVDVQAVVRSLEPQVGKIQFKSLLRHFKLPVTEELRAMPRAEALSGIYGELLKRMREEGIRNFSELNEKGRLSEERIRNLRYYHAIILVKNETGRRNLYTLVSESHLHYFNRRPRIPRSLLNKYRDGLILGSACSAGELYQAVLGGASEPEIAGIVNYYDYLEIQPAANNFYMLRDPKYGIASEADLQDINRMIVRYGEQFDKPVCATCDVHFMNPEDAIYRTIIQSGNHYDASESENQPPLFLRTTDEMLKEFEYLGEKKAYEVVVENTNLIADRIEKISPIYPDKCPPSIPNSEEDLHDICYETAHSLYGDPLPEIVKSRLDRELNSIISNGYAVMYIIAQKLVDKSNEDGYLVGSRGSVGSSFAATMARITEVNPLPPHYRCPECLYSDFDSEEPQKAHEEGRCGCDMPDRICPRCGTKLIKDGFDIPFETFLGFEGNKEPDIDLNFSGDEQGVAQAYTEVIFGKGQTFKAGTIGTVADKTAIGYALGYFEEKGVTKKRCELERLASGCVGVRRTTGQHPGGVIVLPKGMDINWFTPVQHPANDVNSPIITTHFDYHSIDQNLLKLDILGHDDPTIIRMLGDLTGTDPKKVPLDDKGVLSLFSGTEALGVTAEDLDGCDRGTLGVPEFGTNFVMGMLRDTNPSTFSELIRISGLSHGTNVWLDNAQFYIRNGDCTLGSAICTRDDIMLNLINQGVEPEHSFKIMESVRKGKGLTADQEAEMRSHGVPDWYIESCKKIKYMFPKAHAAAYVMNAFRIAYYKINYPLAYYAAMFSIRIKTFNYERMCLGRERLEFFADQIRSKPEPSEKEKAELDDMKLVREMYARGFEFCPIDLYRASALKCRIEDGKIMPSFASITGMGDTQALSVEAAAKKGPFLSKDDFRDRTKVSKTIADLMAELGILKDIPESNQFSLFDL